jgi:glycosyltransferase involved in cell wall biosynthesis
LGTEAVKVSLISASYPPIRCGVGDQVGKQAALLAEAGETVQVLTSGPGVGQPEDRVEVLRQQPGWSVLHLPALENKVRQLAPDVVHLHYPSLGYGLGLAPNLLFLRLRLARSLIRRVVTLHEYQQFTWKGRARLWPTLRFAHRIICTNRLDQKKLESDFPACLGKIQVIPLGNPLAEEPAQVGAKRTAPGLVHFGTVMPNKGWEDLLLALARLRQQGRPQRLLAITALEPDTFAYHLQIKRRIAELGLASEIVFTGYLPAAEASARLRTGRIAVQPYPDGARLNRSSLVTVLAHGLAVLSTDPPQVLGELTVNKHYWAVRPRDPSDLAQGILHLLDHPELVEQLQAQALAVSRDYFSWPRIISLTRGLYQQLLAAR